MSEEIARRQSLYSIASDLSALAEIADDIDQAPEIRDHAKLMITEAVKSLETKTETIRAMIRHADMEAAEAKREADTAASFARRLDRRAEWLRSLILDAMRALPPDSKGRRVLKAPIGSISVQAAGPVPVVIDQPDLVPDEYCRMVGWVRADAWQRLLDSWLFKFRDEDYKLERVPNSTLIREALERDCDTCGGLKCILAHEIVVCDTCKGLDEEPCEDCLGKPKTRDFAVPCPACSGTGKCLVPGARFGNRTESLKVK